MSLSVNALPLAGLVKNETQKIHTEVENILIPRLSSIQTKDDYTVILKMFYGYFRPVERAIEQQLRPSHLSDVMQRRKAAFILHDLRQLGDSAEHLPLCATLPHIASTAQAFGAMYVLEGSTLGGRMIVKMLAKNGVVPETALQFFSGYGEKTGSQWKAFLEVFNQQPDQETIVTTALETFLYLKGWMQRLF